MIVFEIYANDSLVTKTMSDTLYEENRAIQLEMLQLTKDRYPTKEVSMRIKYYSFRDEEIIYAKGEISCTTL